ncbi:MAG: hypothetical protein JRF70_06185 [Deltaproteobacteria bacterium]|nr:hypothetical protein [Deltaproteobacteria bacterium]
MSLLAQGRIWRAELSKDGSAVVLAPQRDGLPEELSELRELRVEVPLERWNAVVKHAWSDRKLLGGVLLDFASPKEHVAAAMARDRVWVELARVVIDATAALVEGRHLVLEPASKGNQ